MVIAMLRSAKLRADLALLPILHPTGPPASHPTIKILIGVLTKRTGSTLTTKESIPMVVGLSRRGWIICELPVKTPLELLITFPGETGDLRGYDGGVPPMNGLTKDLYPTFRLPHAVPHRTA